MHVPRPLFDVRRFVLLLQYNFKRPLTLTLTMNRGLRSGNIVLRSGNIVLICFLERLCGGAKIITMFVYCAAADLHSLVNNNTMTQQGSCIGTKRLLNLFV